MKISPHEQDGTLLPPFVKHASVVVDGTKENRPAAPLDSQTKGGSLGGIYLKLTDEPARRREFHDFTELARVRVDGIAVGGDEVAIGSQCQR